MMSTMVREVYEAFRDAGASEEKATAAAESLVIQFLPRDSTEVATRSDISSLRKDLRGEISGLRKDLRGEISGLREELRGEISGLREELRGEISSLEKRLSTVETRLSSVETRLSVVETRLGVTEKLLWGVLLGVVALVVKAYLPI